ncbi:MAG: superoxide dismutase family protein [Thermoanaerobaculia bacterium]|nr:superoxide dismutase family protein [Thermoanaerobaculia bacterium]
MKTLRYVPSATLMLALLTSAAFLGCAAPGSDDVVSPDETAAAAEAYEPEAVVPTKAHAVLTPIEGSSVQAAVNFTEVAGGVQVNAWVLGAEPGDHGFHLHEVGDCSAADFTSAGGHFNPTAVQHGGPGDALHHAGDWGNLVVNSVGSGALSVTTNMLSVGPGANSVVGRAVILHSGTDDLVSQPSGDAGPRIACGVVELGSAPPMESMESMESTESTEEGSDDAAAASADESGQ